MMMTSSGGRLVSVINAADDRAGDSDHRADRKVDAFGRDHQRHADCQQHGWRAPIENIDHAADQAPIDQPEREETRRDQSVAQQDQDQGENRKQHAPIAAQSTR